MITAPSDPDFTCEKTDHAKWPWLLLTDPHPRYINVPGTWIHDYYQIKDKVLTVKKGYAWNGASGPAIDDITTIRASCFHDAMYQMIEDGELDEAVARKPADLMYKDIMLEDGAPWWRAAYHYWAVRLFGGLFAR